MKKITAFLLAMIMVLSFCACKSKKKNSVSGADVKQYVKLGQIPESDYKLGDNVDKALEKMKSEYKPAGLDGHSDEEEAQAELPVFENGEYTEIMCGDFQYYYKTEKKDSGICAIVSFSKAFGFESDTVSVEVINGLKSRGIDAELKKGTLNDYYFLSFGSDECEYITYSANGNTAVFVFVESRLSAAAVYVNEL